MSTNDYDTEEFCKILNEHGIAAYSADDGIVVGITKEKLHEFIAELENGKSDRILLTVDMIETDHNELLN